MSGHSVHVVLAKYKEVVSLVMPNVAETVQSLVHVVGRGQLGPPPSRAIWQQLGKKASRPHEAAATFIGAQPGDRGQTGALGPSNSVPAVRPTEASEDIQKRTSTTVVCVTEPYRKPPNTHPWKRYTAMDPYDGILHSNEKGPNRLLLGTMWLNLTDETPRKRSQTKRSPCSMISFLSSPIKGKTNSRIG